MTAGGASMGLPARSAYSQPSSAPRFDAGTGFAGAKSATSPSASTTSLISRGEHDGRSQPRKDNAPPGLEDHSRSYNNSRQNEYTNGHSMGSTRSQPPQLQASRPAPPRPPMNNTPKPNVPKRDPNSSTLAQRSRAQEVSRQQSGDDGARGTNNQPVPIRKDSIQYQQNQPQSNRPPITPAKSMPATSKPATEPVQGPAMALAGPPPIKPLQTAKKLPPPGDSPGVMAATAALEKAAPKAAEKRISTMTEAQIMDKLRSVVSPDDPKTLYSTIKKVGQG